MPSTRPLTSASAHQPSGSTRAAAPPLVMYVNKVGSDG